MELHWKVRRRLGTPPPATRAAVQTWAVTGQLLGGVEHRGQDESSEARETRVYVPALPSLTVGGLGQVTSRPQPQFPPLTHEDPNSTCN